MLRRGRALSATEVIQLGGLPWGDARLRCRPELGGRATYLTGGGPDEQAPMVRAALAPNGARLPRQLTSFVGRERELGDVITALRGHRLLTICGPGGAGKTRLALAAAERLLPAFPGGVFLAEIADVTDPQLVATSVASALGIRERPGVQIVTSLIDALGEAQVLILLENCEHQAAACGELAWRLPRLPIPGPDGDPQSLPRHDSVRLFVERARSFQPSFTLSGANASAVGTICRLTEGIPLAIELAAGRLTTLSVEQVADQLRDALNVLTTSSRAVPARHRTLRATIDWSYERLGGSEKALFTRLSVFSGLASLDAVRAVCAGAALPEVDVLDTLARLIDKSLVHAEAAPRELRYRLLELPRQYATERLEAEGEADRVRARHAGYFAALAE